MPKNKLKRRNSNVFIYGTYFINPNFNFVHKPNRDYFRQRKIGGRNNYRFKNYAQKTFDKKGGGLC